MLIQVKIDQNLKYQKVVPSGYKEIMVSKFEFVAKIQFPDDSILLRYINQFTFRYCESILHIN